MIHQTFAFDNKYILQIEIRKDYTCQVKIYSISWKHIANIHPFVLCWMTWTRTDSLPSYSSFRQFFRFWAARFASLSFSSYFSRLSRHADPFSPSLFLSFLPFSFYWFFFFTLSLLGQTFIFSWLYFYLSSLSVFSCEEICVLSLRLNGTRWCLL